VPPIVLAGALLIVAGLPSTAAAAACKALPGPAQSVWTVSATQVGDDLVLVDSLNERLLRFPLDGDAFSLLHGSFERSLKGNWPAAVRTAGDDLLVELGGFRSDFVKLDRSLDPVPASSRSLIGSESPDGSSIAANWIWEPVGGDEIVSCGDVYLGGGDADQPSSYYTGFLRFAYDSPASFVTLLRRPAEPPLRLACRLALPLIAALGDTVYLAVPGAEPGLYRHAPGETEARRLPSYPAQLAGWLKDPTPELTRSQFAPVMRKVEETAMPVGLFAWESSLYLLSRAPAGDRTVWSLTRVDPETGEARGTRRIDSTANHLMLVPGDTYWAAIDKGPARSLGFQKVNRVVAIPAEQIRVWDGGTICQGLGSGR
jgi:hypothetical protein